MKRKITAVLLCVALILGVTPIVYAQDIIDNTIPATIDNNFVQIESEPYIIGELTEKRTEDTKHFLMSDRSIVAAMYNEVVHYDNNGAWEDIDNSFSEDRGRKTGDGSRDGRQGRQGTGRQGTVLCLAIVLHVLTPVRSTQQHHL